jgi:hypothetical protein
MWPTAQNVVRYEMKCIHVGQDFVSGGFLSTVRRSCCQSIVESRAARLVTRMVVSHILSELQPNQMRHISTGTPQSHVIQLASNVLKRHSYRPGCHHSSSGPSLSSLKHAAPYPAPSDYTLFRLRTLFAMCQGWCSIQLASAVSILPPPFQPLPSARGYPAPAHLV